RNDHLPCSRKRPRWVVPNGGVEKPILTARRVGGSVNPIETEPTVVYGMRTLRVSLVNASSPSKRITSASSSKSIRRLTPDMVRRGRLLHSRYPRKGGGPAVEISSTGSG